jgi:YD repeat-containing protein
MCLSAPTTQQALTIKSKGKTMSFTYDNLGRLTVITYSNGTTVTFNYDTAGNRTSVVTNCPTGTC